MPTDTVRIEDFISQNSISITCAPAPSNPSMDCSIDMDHWKCTLTRRAAVPRVDARGVDLLTHKRIVGRMSLVFSQGYGHGGKEPKLASVLDCLASDAAGIENAPDFEEWCGEYGYDADSRKAEKIYKACKHQAARLKTFLGDDLYSQLLWHTERD